jgi:hypothetical protein
LALAQFRKTINPVGVGAVCGGRINDAWSVARHRVHHGHRFAGGIVMQAQHHQVDLGHQGAFGFRVFALGWVNTHQRDLRHQSQTLANVQAGGPRFAVDKNLSHGEKSFAKKQR